MMGTCSREERDLFFDAHENFTSTSDSDSDCPDNFNFGSSPWPFDPASGSSPYKVWVNKPESVQKRREKFFKWMGMGPDQNDREESADPPVAEFLVETDRITEDSGAVLGNSDSEYQFWSSRSSMSCRTSDTRDSSECGASEENCTRRIKNLDSGTEFIADDFGQDGMLSGLPEVGLNQLVTAEEFQRRETDVEARNPVKATKRKKIGWLRRLGAMAGIVDRQGRGGKLKPNDFDLTTRSRFQRVRVHPRKKRSKEFSALYMGQEILAHKGSILTMKFSLDGQYLASAGEDGIVCVWQIMESKNTNDVNIPDIDPSCVYFKVNQFSKLDPLIVDKEKMGKFKNPRKTSDSACVILPQRVFRISEKPLHVFHQHNGEILDLSWSKNKFLLSSSTDKTVRLWQVGCNQCLKVFSHNTYVTSVQFNPVDDNYFISGSIDGKVRIWAIPDCRVVDWTDIGEIVTAVCYRPNGQGSIVGSMTGNCRFYNASDNQLQLDVQISLPGKRKFPGRRITGFQFSPSDPSKLMVTSADSQVRILDGVDVVHRYKGFRNAGSQISASFTSDGKHIVSASEDSNVYVWNYNNQDGPAPSQPKSIRSCERFVSSNVSVAIPWCSMRSGNSVLSTTMGTHSAHEVSGNPPGSTSEYGWKHCLCNENSNSTLPLSLPEFFSLGNGFFSEGLPKGSATWPEEKLPISTSLAPSSMSRSQYRLLKSSCNYKITSPHAWDQVIVTASRDGRIRSFHNYGLPICP